MNHPFARYRAHMLHFANDYYDALHHILDTEPSDRSIGICEGMLREYMSERFVGDGEYGEIRAGNAVDMLCGRGEFFLKTLKIIACDGKGGRQKIREDSLSAPLRSMRAHTKEEWHTEDEIRRKVKSFLENKKILMEANLGRVLDHMSTFQSGCVSAERWDMPKRKNRNLSAKLRGELAGSPYHFIEVQGVYVVDGNAVKEKSYFVYDYDNAGGLLRFLKGKMDDYEQDSILFVEPSGDINNPIDTAALYPNEGGIEPLGRKIRAYLNRSNDIRDIIRTLMETKAEYLTRVRGATYFTIVEYADREDAEREFLMEKAAEYGI